MAFVTFKPLVTSQGDPLPPHDASSLRLIIRGMTRIVRSCFASELRPCVEPGREVEVISVPGYFDIILERNVPARMSETEGHSKQWP
jgi:hypothetical protein